MIRGISPRTRLFAALGHPIAHSLSPLMHNAAISAMGLDAAYLAFDVPPERLIPMLHSLRELSFAGVNLTIPLKETAFRGLENLDDSARRLGSVNTVQITETGLRGYSTDGDGFLRAFEEDFGCSVQGKSVFVLGCGGAGRAVAIACAMAGATHLRLANRTDARARTLADSLHAMPDHCRVDVVESSPAAWREAAKASDVILHASSVGLNANEPPLLDSTAFCPGQLVYDLIYTVPETPILAAARAAGARTANGLGMLIHQGAISFRIWTGLDEPINAMRAALEPAVYGARNRSIAQENSVEKK